MFSAPNSDSLGFTHPAHSTRLHRYRSAVVAQLVATLALIVATAIAMAAVTMEIAEAGVLNSAHDVGGGVAFAALLALAMACASGVVALLPAVSARGEGERKDRGLDQGEEGGKSRIAACRR